MNQTMNLYSKGTVVNPEIKGGWKTESARENNNGRDFERKQSGNWKHCFLYNENKWDIMVPYK